MPQSTTAIPIDDLDSYINQFKLAASKSPQEILYLLQESAPKFAWFAIVFSIIETEWNKIYKSDHVKEKEIKAVANHLLSLSRQLRLLGFTIENTKSDVENDLFVYHTYYKCLVFNTFGSLTEERIIKAIDTLNKIMVENYPESAHKLFMEYLTKQANPNIQKTKPNTPKSSPNTPRPTIRPHRNSLYANASSSTSTITGSLTVDKDVEDIFINLNLVGLTENTQSIRGTCGMIETYLQKKFGNTDIMSQNSKKHGKCCLQ